MTLAEYIRDPAPKPSLSASVAHVLLTQSARHAWLAHPRLNPSWKPAESSEMDLGTIAHAVLLEGDWSRVSVVDAPDWRKADARAARDDARARGLLPILQRRLADVAAMVDVAKTKIAATREIATAWADGKAEQTLIWEEDGIYSRCRPDFLTNDCRLLLDYKTVGGSAEPSAWSRGQLFSMGYFLQAAFCLAAVKALRTPRDCSFVFMAQEVEPPFAVSFVGLSPAYEEFAERCRRRAVALWKHCLTTNKWPEYPDRICWSEPPAWAVTQFEDWMPLDEGAGVEAL